MESEDYKIWKSGGEWLHVEVLLLVGDYKELHHVSSLLSLRDVTQTRHWYQRLEDCVTFTVSAAVSCTLGEEER